MTGSENQILSVGESATSLDEKDKYVGFFVIFRNFFMMIWINSNWEKKISFFLSLIFFTLILESWQVYFIIFYYNHDCHLLLISYKMLIPSEFIKTLEQRAVRITDTFKITVFFETCLHLNGFQRWNCYFWGTNFYSPQYLLFFCSFVALYNRLSLFSFSFFFSLWLYHNEHIREKDKERENTKTIVTQLRQDNTELRHRLRQAESRFAVSWRNSLSQSIDLYFYLSLTSFENAYCK